MAAAIAKQEDLNERERNILVAQLMKLPDAEINTRVLDKMGAGAVRKLDAAAKTSSADPKLYKVLQLVSLLNRSETGSIATDEKQ